MSDRHVLANLELTDTRAQAQAQAQAQALAKACAASDNAAIINIGGTFQQALVDPTTPILLQIRWEGQAVTSQHDAADCIKCEVEKFHTDSNVELCLGCPQQFPPTHAHLRLAA